MIERDIYVLNDVVKTPIDYVRGTNAIPIVFHFRDYDIPSGATAEVFVFNRDGTGTQDNADISGNDVEIQPVTDLFSEMGEAVLQVKISKNSNVLVTFAYPVNVRPNYTEGDTKPGGNHSGFFDELQAAADAANEAAENADAKAQAANQAAQSANQASQQIQQNAAAGNYSASVEIGAVTTGDPGTQASVTNSGTAKDAIFNFVIPQGPKGPTGPIGPQGPTGTIENLPTATVEFTEASEKENIQSGDTVAVMFGKIQKYFTDLDTYWPRLNNIEQVDLEDVFSNMSTVNGITFSGKLTVFTFGINHSPYLVKLVNLSLDVTVNNRVIPQITSLGPVSSGYKNLFGNSGIAQAPTIDIVYLDGSGGTEVGARIGFYPYVTDFNGVMYNVDSTSGSNKKYTGTATWIA